MLKELSGNQGSTSLTTRMSHNAYFHCGVSQFLKMNLMPRMKTTNTLAKIDVSMTQLKIEGRYVCHSVWNITIYPFWDWIQLYHLGVV